MKTRLTTHGGFTLIELMVTLVVAGILLMVAVPSFMTFRRNSELTSATNTLFAAINAARGEAMKRGTYALVVPANNGAGTAWSNGWVVFADGVTLHDRVYNSADDKTVLTQPALPSYFSIAGNGNADDDPAYIMFDASGYPKSKSGGVANMTLTIRRNDVSGSPSAKCEQVRNIMVGPTGRVRTCKPVSNTDTACQVVGTPCS